MLDTSGTSKGSKIQWQSIKVLNIGYIKLVDLDLISGGQLHNHDGWWLFGVPVYCCRPMWAWGKNEINSDLS